MNSMQKTLAIMTVVLAGPLLCGCAAAPHVQFAAADSMDLVASSLHTAIEEYRHDLDELDTQRRKAVVDAFVARVKADHADDDVIALHAASFAAALDRVDADRQAGLERRQVALENLGTLREVADGLRKVAVESMNLDDEARRYLGNLVSRTRTTSPSTSGESHDVPQ